MNISEIDWPRVVFVTGIGTDVGKSFVTGWIAREMIQSGLDVITQKFIQTGNYGISEDIERHRKIMGIDLLPEDEERLTAPVILTYPASPHLAAEIDKTYINREAIMESTEELLNLHDFVIIEGAGGIMVPVEGNYLTADYVREQGYPVVLAVTGQLGSINHALLSMLALKTYGIPVFAVVYNPYFDKDEIICADTRKYLKEWIEENSTGTLWLEMPVI